MNAYGIHGRHLVARVDGKPMGGQTLSKLVVEAAKAAGLPPERVPHGICKCCSGSPKASASIKAIAVMSGHKTVAEVHRYKRGGRPGGASRS